MTNNQIDERPLVSVIVITYNSSKFIEAGLNSITNQVYNNIEIIISDDCSTDNTVDICKQWEKQNSIKFERVKIIEAQKNTGVAGNLNRAIKASHGEWIKTLSGDDQFLPNTIKDYVEYINNVRCDIVFGRSLIVGDEESITEYYDKLYNHYIYPKLKRGIDQKRENLKSLLITSPGLFYSRKLYDKIGGYDERYQFCEEDPFLFKVYSHGYNIEFLDKIVYKYLVRPDSLGSIKHTNRLSRYQKDSIKFFFDIRRRALCREKFGILYAFDQTLLYNMLLAADRGDKYIYALYRILRLLSPIYIYSKIKTI